MPSGRAFGHCFACGYRRTWIGYVLERLGHSPEAKGAAIREALGVLATRAGIPIDVSIPSEMETAVAPLALLAGLLKQNLLSEHPRARACRDYLASRGVPSAALPGLPLGAWTETQSLSLALRNSGLSSTLLSEYGLAARYVPYHPLLFVYEDADGVTGFKCRKPSIHEKSVLNALGFGGAVEGRSLFGLGVARDMIERYCRVIVVEGEFDALGWYAASFAVGRSIELVALGGTAKPTVEKFRTLRALGARVAYLALDGDLAGEAATAVACRRAWEAELEVGILSMPDGCKDPDEVLARHGAREGADLIFAFGRAEPGAVWLARYQLRQVPPVTLEQASRLRNLSAETARALPRSARGHYAEIIAEAVGRSSALLLEDWRRLSEGAELPGETRTWS
jgi:DNA primase